MNITCQDCLLSFRDLGSSRHNETANLLLANIQKISYHTFFILFVLGLVYALASLKGRAKSNPISSDKTQSAADEILSKSTQNPAVTANSADIKSNTSENKVHTTAGETLNKPTQNAAVTPIIPSSPVPRKLTATLITTNNPDHKSKPEHIEALEKLLTDQGMEILNTPDAKSDIKFMIFPADNRGHDTLVKHMEFIQDRLDSSTKPLIVILAANAITLRTIFLCADKPGEPSGRLQNMVEEEITNKHWKEFYVAPLPFPNTFPTVLPNLSLTKNNDIVKVQNNPRELAKFIAKWFLDYLDSNTKKPVQSAPKNKRHS